MSTVETNHQIKSKRSLVQASKKLFLRYGIKSVSMDDIAKLLGISKKTIYNLIPNKTKLVEAAVRQHIAEEESSINQIILQSNSAIEEMILIARQALKTISQIKPTMAYDLKKYHNKTWSIVEGQHFNYIREVIEKNIQRGITDGTYRKELSPSIVSLLYLSLVRMTSNENLQIKSDQKMTDVFESMVKYHLHAITNNRGKEELNSYYKNKLI